VGLYTRGPGLSLHMGARALMELESSELKSWPMPAPCSQSESKMLCGGIIVFCLKLIGGEMTLNSQQLPWLPKEHLSQKKSMMCS